jgi:hypothetical protein
MPSVRPRKIEITLAAPEHAPLMEAFFKSVWQGSGPFTPAVVSPSVLAIQDDRVIGYLGTLPFQFWDGEREQTAHWFKGFMVLPEFQNGPLGFALMKEAAKHLPIALVITVQPASWRLFKAIGLTHVGALENRLRLLRPARVLSTLDVQRVGLGPVPFRLDRGLRLAQRLKVAGAGGAAAGLALGAWAMVRGFPGRRVEAHVANTLDLDDYDALWVRVRLALRFAQVRDAAYVKARYSGNPLYTVIEARDGKELVGFGAIREPKAGGDDRLPGLVLPVLSDVLFHPARRDAALAVLQCAERIVAARGADALVCSASGPALLAALSARAYLRIPATLQFLAKLGPDQNPGSMSDWWLCRSDGNSDF